MTRAEAIAKAIDQADPGDDITIHGGECADPSLCTCQPKVIYVGGEAPRNPLGFRRR